MSEQQERPTCETCPYWVQSTEDDEDHLGECRRNPPRLLERSFEETEVQYMSSFYPWTLCNEFCGEHPSMAAWIEQQRKEPQ